jgi:hypothetical protein
MKPEVDLSNSANSHSLRSTNLLGICFEICGVGLYVLEPQEKEIIKVI